MAIGGELAGSQLRYLLDLLDHGLISKGSGTAGDDKEPGGGGKCKCFPAGFYLIGASQLVEILVQLAGRGCKAHDGQQGQHQNRHKEQGYGADDLLFGNLFHNDSPSYE